MRLGRAQAVRGVDRVMTGHVIARTFVPVHRPMMSHAP